MSRDWIGIAEDLTEHGVIGSPYAQPSTLTPSNVGTGGYPAPPKNGRVKTFLIVAGVVAVGAMTPPGKTIVTSIENKFLSPASNPPAQSSSANVGKPAIANTAPDANISQPNLPASAAPQQLANEPAPKKKQVKQKRAASSDRPASPASESATDTSPPATETEVDLTKYRNLTGRI